MKLVWKVQPKPTGTYRSFARRGWPTADLPNGATAFRIVCDDEYEPSAVRAGTHAELTVYVAAWRQQTSGTGVTFDWRRLKRRAATLAEAKTLADSFVAGNPGFFELAR